MTTTTRERFEEKFHRIVEDECILSKHRDEDGCFEKSDLDDVWSFIETIEKEARQEGREEMKVIIEKELSEIESEISRFKKK